MNYKKLKFIFAFLLLLNPLYLRANFDFNANCLKAYQHIFELKLNTARQLIALEKKVHPNNSIALLLENYVDYFYLLSTDNKQDFDRLEAKRAERLERISNDDPKSPYYRYALAEINLQWALIRGRYGSYYTAAREINRANNLLKLNSEKFPGFHLNLRGLGLINALMGNLPDGFLKSALAAFGIKGNLQTGLKMLEQLADNLPKSAYEPFYEEAVFSYIYVLNDVAHSTSAYAKAIKYTKRFSDESLLKTYLLAYTASRNGYNDDAIAILTEKPSGAAYQSFPYLDYLMGLAKLNKLDDTAASYFDRFLQTNKGAGYIKDAYLHLAWIALLKDDQGAYRTLIARVKANGYVYQERDRQAINEANAPPPNKQLLSARLLFDGGYLTKAMQMLENCKVETLTLPRDKTEYYYRLGRVNDGLGKEESAIAHYQSAINMGKTLKNYYAAKAAVLIGEIYEKARNTNKARVYFNMAINMKDHEYESSITNEAKQGLRRIGD
ncbi:MAG: tetratricopeptide repeat protein [Bacteroidota bacterium]